MQSSETLKYHTYKFVILSFIALLVLVADHRTGLTTARTALSIIAYPFQVVVDAPPRLIQTTSTFFRDRKRVMDENEALNRMVMVYSAKDQRYRSVQAENERLREVLGMARRSEQMFLIARVLHLQSERFQKSTTIDQGSSVGVFDGQVALSGGGIFGQVIEALPNSSVVLQLSDPRHTIPVRNVQGGATALAVGTGESNIVRLTSIEKIEDVNVGDLYVSSGMGNVFPPDFPVARVIEKQYSPADSMTIVTAQTITDYKNVREVLLTWNTSKKVEQQNEDADAAKNEGGK